MRYFYFEAQTGVIHLHEPTASSNYFRYTFDYKHLAKVKMIVDGAKVGPSGLEYTFSDLDWLTRNEIDRPGGLTPHPGNPNR